MRGAALALALAACSGSGAAPADLAVPDASICAPETPAATLYLTPCSTGAFGFCFRDHVSLDFF